MSKVKNTESEDSPGLTDPLITENLLKIIFKEKENITGLMEENMMVFG